MGYNAAGKSTHVKQYEDIGYYRLNRDIEGGTLDTLALKAESILKTGINYLVLDNTYASVISRASIIKIAKAHKARISCVHITTSLEEAQLNACLRMVRKFGRLLNPEDFKKESDPNTFPPAALFHYRKQFQPPTTSEGFDEIIEVPFVRTWAADYVNKAIILDYDGTLRLSTGPQKYPTKPSEIQMLPNRTKELENYKKAGFILLGASNQSGIARGTVTRNEIINVFEETNRQLGLDIDYQFCPHPSNPITCYCRKPSTGMAAAFIEKYKLLPSKCIMVGDMTSDKTFANRSGFQYIDQKDFFE